MESECYRYGLDINPRVKIKGPRKIEDWNDIFCFDEFCYNDVLILSDGKTCEQGLISSVLSDEEICKEVEKLLAEGKDPNASLGWGNIPLCAAIKRGYVKTVEKLLEAGADPNGTENSKRPLCIAVKNSYVEIVKILLAKGASVDAPSHSLFSDNALHNALHAAAEGCHVEIIELLINAKPNIDARDSNEDTPLILACGHACKNKTMGIKKLIDAGANVKAKNDRGETPLHALAMSECSEQECLKVLQWLIDAGANIHAKDKQGRQPLHLAAQYGNVEMVKKLLELGANPWAETYDHLVPLALVPDDPLSPETKQDKEIRRVLLKAMKEHARKRSGQAKPKRVTPIKRVGRRKTDSQKLESERKVLDYS